MNTYKKPVTNVVTICNMTLKNESSILLQERSIRSYTEMVKKSLNYLTGVRDKGLFSVQQTEIKMRFMTLHE